MRSLTSCGFLVSLSNFFSTKAPAPINILYNDLLIILVTTHFPNNFYSYFMENNHKCYKKSQVLVYQINIMLKNLPT